MTGWCFHCSTFFTKNRLERLIGPLPESYNEQAPSSLEEAERAIKSMSQSIPKQPEIELPGGVPAWQDKRSRAYLQKREVPESLVYKHKMLLCMNGTFSNRIIVPVFDREKARTFTARDITNKKEKKYLFPAGVSSGKWLFNLDNVNHHRTVIVCEGVFDALHLQKFGLPAVASFGKKLSKEQVEKLACFSRTIFAYDSDALQETYTYMKRLGDRASAILLPYGDPTSFSEAELLKMLKNRVSLIDVAKSIVERRQ